MKKLFFMAVAAIAALSSCTSDNELELNQNTGKEALTFTATMEGIDGTRATFDATTNSMKWEIGDKINIGGHDPAKSKFVYADYSAQTAGATTTFAAVGDELPVSDLYQAVFPSYLNDKEAIESGWKSMPAYITETWKEGLFSMPMYAESITTDLEFKNLCGVLKIVVKSDQLPSVKRIRVSNSSKGLSGYFEIDYDVDENGVDWSPILVMKEGVMGYSETNAITVTYTAAVETDATGKAFYIAIPPYDKYRDLQIEIDPDGNGFTKLMKTKADKDINIERSKIYEIPFASQASAPSGSKGKAVVNSEAGVMDNEVHWIQLWENGPKFAEYNVGVTDGRAESYGGYYTWGGTYANGYGIAWNDTFNDGSVALTGEYDTATNLWGSNWRMPTSEELQALFDENNCNAEIIEDSYYNVLGIKFTGTGDYSANSIFLPAGGYVDDSEVSEEFEAGCYWSSTPDEDLVAPYLYYSSGEQGVDCCLRDYGLSVRAVLNEAPAAPTPPEGSRGTAKATIDGEGVDVNWVQLWADGPKFAEFNVGAASASEYGGYYCWGGTYKNGPAISWNDDHNTGTSKLSGDTDTATKLWGSNWRMPTNEEIRSIVLGQEENLPCTVTWTDNYNGTGIKGGIITGKGAYSTNSIFLPAAGWLNNGTMTERETLGYYWSSQYEQYVGWDYIKISSSEKKSMAAGSLNRAYSVRAVLNESAE